MLTIGSVVERNFVGARGRPRMSAGVRYRTQQVYGWNVEAGVGLEKSAGAGATGRSPDHNNVTKGQGGSWLPPPVRWMWCFETSRALADQQPDLPAPPGIHLMGNLNCAGSSSQTPGLDFNRAGIVRQG